MRKINLRPTVIKNALSPFFAVLLALAIISVNILFFSFTNTSTSAFSNIFSVFTSDQATEEEGKLAIIIDDFGQSRDGVREMMEINRHLTFAIMPFLAFSKTDAELAHEKGFEVIVHLPMESNVGKLNQVGPRPILTAMNDGDIQRLIVDSFESIPYAVGANVHMGSKASDDERVISDILDIIKIKNLYFVDSRTGRHPVSRKIAAEKGVLCYDRDVFLDGTKSKEAIKKQLDKAANIALKRGKAVAIGHVGIEGGKATAQAITEMLDELDERKVELVFVSELGK